MPFLPPITTPDVKAVAALTTEDLSLHIANAETFMDAVFADVEIALPLYRLIGVYICAHFAFVQEGQIKTDKVDVLSTTFNMESDLALNSTVHGQQAIAMDVTGTLAKLNAQAKKAPTAPDAPHKASITFC